MRGLADAFVIDAEFAFDVGAEVLDNHVGLLRQALEYIEAFWILC
jgi:hypothetical protein